MKRILLGLLAALTVFTGTQIVSPGVALAEDTSIVKHRDNSQIPTIRLWTEDRSTEYFDLARGQVAGYFNIPFKLGYVYVPTGWCLEANLYLNGVFRFQQRTGPGPLWYHVSQYPYYYSLFIHDPGADGICN